MENSYLFEHRNEMIGKRIRCLHMYDPLPVPPQSMGTILFIDDLGNIHVKWDNGRNLSIIPDEDNFEIID